MPVITSLSDARRLREYLAAEQYTQAGLQARRAIRKLPMRYAGNLPLLLDATSEPTPFNVIARLFLFGLEQPGSHVARVLTEDVVRILIDTQMVSGQGDALLPQVMLTPFDDNWIASDPLFRFEPHRAPDLVLWPNQTSRALENLSFRDACDGTLDLGTGCGVIAMLAATFSRRVTGTDLNPRAAGFVLFNAWLNGRDGITALTGDTFAPIGNDTFDRILANPPFMVTPSRQATYGENSMELDEYCRRVVREAPQHLNEGGFLQMVLEFVELRGEPWQESLADWAEHTGCDFWARRTYSHDADTYAHTRTSREFAHSPEAATERFNRYVEYYRSRNVQAVHGALIVMRRRSGKNWIRLEDGPIEGNEPYGDLVRRIFETQDVLTQCSDRELLALYPVLSPDVQLQQQMIAGGRQWKARSLTLAMAGAMPSSMPLDPSVASFLALCDGAQPLQVIVSEIARGQGEAEQVERQCCAAVRALAARRFVNFHGTPA